MVYKGYIDRKHRNKHFFSLLMHLVWQITRRDVSTVNKYHTVMNPLIWLFIDLRGYHHCYILCDYKFDEYCELPYWILFKCA